MLSTKKCFAVVAGVSLVLALSVPEDSSYDADLDDSCDASGACDLSLRQLRATSRNMAVAEHSFADPNASAPVAGNATNGTNGTNGTSPAELDPQLLGAFCCQNGQGLGYTDASDMGASCYPSAKAEINGYCDDEKTCAPNCNGTWITGFCALSKTDGATDPCTTEMNQKGTGYVYTGSTSRALQGEACGSEDACNGCNGTWCLYVKEVIY
mmetsp:Transcript_89535/g.258234  ORF Transcript_89535/g.258234 Transcript_89535/m.258234 type:complete len:211 (+) Transcript_89535:77-709(+)